jgi:AsmA protein
VIPGKISQKIKTFANRSIDGKMEFSKARLSFFNHFPSLTLTLYDFSSTGSAPFQNEKLLSAGEIAMGIRIPALIPGEKRLTSFIYPVRNYKKATLAAAQRFTLDTPSPHRYRERGESS